MYPSIYEGFGRPLLEAMQCGIPIVCSNNSSITEIVGDAALTSNYDDVNFFTKNILDLLNWTCDDYLNWHESRIDLEYI